MKIKRALPTVWGLILLQASYAMAATESRGGSWRPAIDLVFCALCPLLVSRLEAGLAYRELGGAHV